MTATFAPFGGEPFRDRRADAAARTGHEGHASFELSQSVLLAAGRRMGRSAALRCLPASSVGLGPVIDADQAAGAGAGVDVVAAGDDAADDRGHVAGGVLQDAPAAGGEVVDRARLVQREVRRGRSR